VVKITDQITIKLNKDRFEKLLDDMMQYVGSVDTRSELVGKALWFLYCFAFQKIPKQGNKSQFQFFLEQNGMTLEEFINVYERKYLQFLRTKKPF
jgi:hypothetical protein